MMIRPATREYRTWTIDSRRWSAYEPRAGDIIIATAPKCGTTWMQQIVSSLVFQDASARALSTVSPWIDARHHGRAAADLYLEMAAQTHRRFPKTHLPIDGLPIFDEVQYIHVARDGRDACMSMHNYFVGFTNAQLERLDQIGIEDPLIGRLYPRAQLDPAEYYRSWISNSDDTSNAAFFELEVGYWAERKRSNFLMVHFNDLLYDLDAEMRRVAAFLEIEVNEPIWPSHVRAAVFEEMQSFGDALMPGLANRFSGGSRRMFNKGTNGRWRDILRADDLALYDAKVREKLPPGLAAWLEAGRHATGDPRNLAD